MQKTHTQAHTVYTQPPSKPLRVQGSSRGSYHCVQVGSGGVTVPDQYNPFKMTLILQQSPSSAVCGAVRDV